MKTVTRKDKGVQKFVGSGADWRVDQCKAYEVHHQEGPLSDPFRKELEIHGRFCTLGSRKGNLKRRWMNPGRRMSHSRSRLETLRIEEI
eukprot:5383476-Amphidinium_carterae.1